MSFALWRMSSGTASFSSISSSAGTTRPRMNSRVTDRISAKSALSTGAPFREVPERPAIAPTLRRPVPGYSGPAIGAGVPGAFEEVGDGGVELPGRGRAHHDVRPLGGRPEPRLLRRRGGFSDRGRRHHRPADL